MSRTPDQIAPDVFGHLIYSLLARIASLQAEVERLAEKLAKLEKKS